MSNIQTADEIRGFLNQIEGETIDVLQVLGINTLKSLSPSPEALMGARVTSASVHDRSLTIQATSALITVDLQRTGRLVWLPAAERLVTVAGAKRPTVRFVLASGTGLDITEPAKTKRVTVTLSAP